MADSATIPAVKNTVELEADVNVEFNEAASRQQINSGESVKTLFGKLRKFLTDLKAVAFTGAYSDLNGTPDLSWYASKSKYGDTTINVGRKADTTVGEYSTAEGSGTTASGNFSHTEGSGTTASGNGSHSEGGNSIASGSFSHAEGADTTASNYSSHAGGSVSEASGRYSFSHGNRTQALHESEVAFGQNNISNDDTLFSIGDGAYNARHNAFEITTTGGKLHDKDIAVIDDIPSELPANGGNSDTVDGVHISCTNDAASGSNWFAAFTDGSNLRAIDPARAYVGNAGNADTVDGLHAWNMATLSAGGGSHGTSYPMYCQHNVLGDGRFYIGVGNGYERSVAVGYAETAGSVPVNAIIKSASFTVTTNSSGWNTLGITYPAYNIIGYQCNTSDYRVELYKGNSATEWYVYAIQQYPNPGVVATNKAVSVTIFYI